MNAANERIELYIQGAIAFAIVTGIIAIAVAQTSMGKPIQVPDLLGFALAGVLGYFFGTGKGRALSSGVETATNGMLSAASRIAEAQHSNQEMKTP